MTLRDAEALQERSKVLCGTFIWRVRLNIQHRFEEGYSPEDLDELWLDFRVVLRVPEKVKTHQRVGSLWMSADTGIRLEQGGGVLVASGDSVAKVLDQFPKLVGSRLLNVEVRPPAGDTRFIFENDLVLNSFPARFQDGSSWIIRTESGDELKLGPGAPGQSS